METAYISKCCNVEAEYVYNDNNDGYLCPKCKLICEVEEVCADCLGTGEVTTMETVYAGEPHQAPIGTRRCHCQQKEQEYDNQQ